MEKDLPYRRITGKDKNAYVWMEAKKYIDANENTAIIALHNEKIIQNTVIKMEQELIKKEQDMAKQYWDMVSLLTTVLNHNQLVESGYQDDISFYTKQVYLQLQKKYPEYGITDEEIIRMISNGECGAFSNQLMQCFQEAAKQQNWVKRQN